MQISDSPISYWPTSAVMQSPEKFGGSCTVSTQHSSKAALNRGIYPKLL